MRSPVSKLILHLMSQEAELPDAMPSGDVDIGTDIKSLATLNTINAAIGTEGVIVLNRIRSGVCQLRLPLRWRRYFVAVRISSPQWPNAEWSHS